MTPPSRPVTLALCLLLGILSGACCAWLLGRSSPVSLWVRYAPGAILGTFALIAGQVALGFPPLPVMRAAGLLLASILAWRLALYLRLAGAPLPWISASVVGSLGIGVGILMAWPNRASNKQLLAGLTLSGFAGGALFLLAGLLHLTRRDSVWSLALLCAWQATVLCVVAMCLRQHADR